MCFLRLVMLGEDQLKGSQCCGRHCGVSGMPRVAQWGWLSIWRIGEDAGHFDIE